MMSSNFPIMYYYYFRKRKDFFDSKCREQCPSMVKQTKLVAEHMGNGNVDVSGKKAKKKKRKR